MFAKLVKTALLTLLTYLLQATVANRIAVGGVAPNIALAFIAVVTVCMGRKYTFMMSLTIGYLLEIMLPALDYISMLIYPICAMLGALVFSDKSERKLEEERAQGKRGRQWNPHLRTPLCALLSIAVFEGVNLIYTYLSGVSIGSLHIGRALTDVVYTTLLAAVFQFPIRWWMGTYKLAKAR